MSASDVPEFLKSRVDSDIVMGSPEMHSKFVELLATQNINHTGGKEWGNASKSYANGLASFAQPNPLDPNGPLVSQIAAQINGAAVSTIMKSIDDFERTTPFIGGDPGYAGLTLTPKFQLAAALIESRQASAFAVHLDGNDRHDQETSGFEARYGAVVFSQIRNFWEWVVSKGYQNDVLVLVTQEFSRSPWSLLRKYGSTVVHKGQTINIDAYGTDHHLVGGMMALHGSFTEPSRVGCVGDGYIALAATDLKGTGSLDPKAYPHTSTQMVGSLMMRCFPKEFPDALSVHNVWFNFRDEDVIKPLINA